MVVLCGGNEMRPPYEWIGCGQIYFQNSVHSCIYIWVVREIIYAFRKGECNGARLLTRLRVRQSETVTSIAYFPFRYIGNVLFSFVVDKFV